MRVGILEDSSDRFITDLISRLGNIPVEFIRLADERLPVERGYRVVVDRLSFRYPFLMEMVKSLALDGTYVINNPYAASVTNKLIDINVGRQLELPFPKTVVLPDQATTAEADSQVIPPNLQRVADEIGLPCILKPFNGYAWQDVHVITSIEELQNLYVALAPRYILLVQQLIRFKDYFRVFCIDKKDVLFIRYVPRPSAMGQYLYCNRSEMKDMADRLAALTVRFNQALDLDVNVVEWCVDEEGRWWVIDAFNEVPEIIPEALPPEYYSWILDRFVACIQDKLESGKTNRTPFG
jgi:glutathione synthase/RimK-type ligase-like ATP-grasp enzyme